MKRSERVAAQLGMSQGAANNRLRKSVLFSYVKRAGDNFCFECGEEITDITDFSIEHKLPWEGRDTELFWSLDNIAFSHIQCNTPHHRRCGHSHVKENAPEGTNWCGKCKQYLPVERFAKNKYSHDGYRHYCRECDPPR